MGKMEPHALPLVVDLDGTLSLCDTLHENMVLLFCRRPWRIFEAIFVLLTEGRAALKAKMAAEHSIDVKTLPLNHELLSWLEQLASDGRKLYLVSAAHKSVVEKIADRTRIFAGFCGSDENVNLKGPNKAAYLDKAFPDGFSYAGDSAADLAVWQRAKGIVLVGASRSVTSRAERLGPPIEARFDRKASFLKALFKECRLHQWSKNALVFVPILLAHHFHDTGAWLNAAYAFLALGISASATYIVNDLFDLETDRAHATKRFRPLASGALGVLPAMAMVPFMLAAGVALALAANLWTLVVLLVYLVLTLSYSFHFKHVALFDTATIGLLFTLRLVLGCAAADLQPSPWLLAFSLMLFFSLAMAKRQTELTKKAIAGQGEGLAERGYDAGDILLSLVYGVSSGVASLVILMMYTTNSAAAGLYHHPAWLWGLPLLIYLWQMRIWLLAHRGILHDDPIVFALKDRISLALGAGSAVAFYLAI